VLQSAPRREWPVAGFLSLHGLQPYVAEFPKPRRTRPGSVRDRRARLVFPGYVFLRVPHGFDDWQFVRWAPGVCRVLEQEGSPAIVAGPVVEHLQERISQRALSQERTGFKVGQEVVVERGPLAAVDALFERALGADSRVRILIEMMGRPVSVTIDSHDLRAS